MAGRGAGAVGGAAGAGAEDDDDDAAAAHHPHKFRHYLSCVSLDCEFQVGEPIEARSVLCTSALPHKISWVIVWGCAMCVTFSALGLLCEEVQCTSLFQHLRYCVGMCYVLLLSRKRTVELFVWVHDPHKNGRVTLCGCAICVCFPAQEW